MLYTKFLHTEKIPGFGIYYSDERYPTVKITPVGKTPDITVFCYGEILEDIEDVIIAVFDEHDIICEVICPTAIQPLNLQPVLNSVMITRKLLTIEEGSSISGLGSEIVAQILERGILVDSVKKMGCNSFLPSSRDAEQALLPDKENIILAIKELTNAR